MLSQAGSWTSSGGAMSPNEFELRRPLAVTTTLTKTPCGMPGGSLDVTVLVAVGEIDMLLKPVTTAYLVLPAQLREMTGNDV